MSDISVNTNINQINTNVTKAPVTSSKTDNTNKSNANSSDSASDVITNEYGPVVSTSEDGDTVRVKGEQNNEGIHDILQREIEELKEAESFETPDFDVHRSAVDTDKIKTTASDDSETVSTEITSYVGYTDSELRQLYLKGDISQIDYNQEMEAREARREAETKDNTDFTNTLANNISRISDVNRNADTINTIENKETSNTIPDELRLQALQNFDTV